jgi:hypothetical protein
MRILGFLLMVVAVWNPSQNQAPAQAGTEAAFEPKWEYRVFTLDSRRCAGGDDGVVAALNNYGRQGWALVSVTQSPVLSPTQAHGVILLRPAATGPGKDVRPQLADSFQGTIDFNLPEAGACRFTFMRQVPTKP